MNSIHVPAQTFQVTPSLEQKKTLPGKVQCKTIYRHKRQSPNFAYFFFDFLIHLKREIETD